MIITDETRSLFFLIGCMGARFGLAGLSLKYNYIVRWISGLLAVGFAVLYFFDLRKTGAEAGGEIWWRPYRIIHSILFGLFAVTGKSALLFVDAVIGLLLFLLHDRL